MIKFFKSLWLTIKILLVVCAVAFVVWFGYNVYQSLSGGITTNGWNDLSNWVVDNISTDGGRGDGGVDGESDTVPDEQKGLIVIPDEIKDDFQNYLDDINDNSGSNYIPYEDNSIFDFDKDNYLPRDMITSEEFSQSNGNVIKTFKYHGKDMMYYSMTFAVDEKKSDYIRFFGYFPATDFKFKPEDALESYLAVFSSNVGAWPLSLFIDSYIVSDWYSNVFPYPEISYHYLSDSKTVFEIAPELVSQRAFLNKDFDFDNFNLYLKHKTSMEKVVRGKSKLLLIDVTPLQVDLFKMLADEFVYSSNYEVGKMFTVDYGKHLMFANKNLKENVKSDFLFTEYECPHNHEIDVCSRIYTVNPTCERAGFTYKFCYLCGETVIVDTIPALGHDWDSNALSTTATCTAPGQSVFVCLRCGEKKTVITPALGHHFEPVVVTPATCTTAGVSKMKCRFCGLEESETVVTPALGHSCGDWTITTPATCTAPGTRSRFCSRCNNVETEVIPELGHSFGSWQVSVQDNKSIKFRVCSVCGHRETAINDTEFIVSINVGEHFKNGSKTYEIVSLYSGNIQFCEYDIGTQIQTGYTSGLFNFFIYKDLSSNQNYVGFYSIYKFDKLIRFQFGNSLTDSTPLAIQSIYFTDVLSTQINYCSCYFDTYPVIITGLQTYSNIQYWL